MIQSGFCNACGVAAAAEALRCASCGALLPPRDDPSDPRRVARALAEALGAGYEVVDEVGRGGYARVFRVRDLTLDRWLAAKVIAPELTTSRDAAERFRREVLTVARLVHPNIVPIYFVPSSAALACCVMPLIGGESLASRLRREGALPLAVAVGIAQDVAAALDAAHAGGVVHRDVKPDNILLEFQSGRALLTDFGIARAPQPGGRITSSGQIVGTPHYASPEQAAGEQELDGRTDQYALGVVLFEMLAGRLPFEAPNAQAIYALHVAAPRPDVRQWRPDVPPAVAAALERALAQEPGSRFRSTGEFAAAAAAGLGRRSLRSSGATVVERMATAEVSLFRATASALAVEDARAPLIGAADLGSFRDAVATAQVSLGAAARVGDGARAADVVGALAAASADERPAFRQEAATALRACATDTGVVDTLARHWLRPEPGAQAAAEHALASLMPEAGAVLLALARRERRSELLLLADRTGALGEQEALALVRDPSAGVAGLLIGELVESQRAPEAVERWLAAALRHPHAEVRRAALAAAVQRGGALAERLGRLGLGDRDAAVRLASLDALGASRRKEAVADLAVVLDARTETERRRAAEALGQLGVPEAIAPLRRVLARRRLLGFRVPPLAEAALDALARLPGREAATELETLASRGGRLGTLARQAIERRSRDVSSPT
jgi:HEAT repeat protein